MESSPSTAAAAAAEELPREYPPFLRIYKDGTVERLVGTKTVPPDPTPSVQSKDVAYSDIQSSNRSKSENEKNKKKKLPVLVYFHGGAFLVESAFSPTYHTYLNSIVAAANVIAVSVDYRRAPEHPLPIAYDDSWTALEWIGSHRSGSGSELWLNEYADLDSVFLAGDSAERGKLYCEVLKESGWKGEVEMLEAEGEGHVFHLMDCECGNAVAMREMICCFIHG
ncbi:Probable carboxylesterase 13 [Linum perenne]